MGLKIPRGCCCLKFGQWDGDFNFLGFQGPAQRAPVFSPLHRFLAFQPSKPPAFLLDMVGVRHRSQALQVQTNWAEEAAILQRAVCPRAEAEGGKYLQNGEVAATNTLVEKRTGENPTGRGGLGRGSPGGGG